MARRPMTVMRYEIQAYRLYDSGRFWSPIDVRLDGKVSAVGRLAGTWNFTGETLMPQSERL